MGALRQTHTYVTLEVSEMTYAEIAGKLRIAGYDHAFNSDGEIDMHGLALVKENAVGLRKLTKEEVERVTKEAPRNPKAEPAEQFNNFCWEPPCASDICRRAQKCREWDRR